MSFCRLANPRLLVYNDLRVRRTVHMVLLDFGTRIKSLTSYVAKREFCEPYRKVQSECSIDKDADNYQNNGNKNSNAVVCDIIFGRAPRTH